MTGPLAPLAHGVGSAEGLPLPLDLVLQAGAATVVMSFLIAAFWWRTPRLKPSEPRRPGMARWLRYPVLLLVLYVTGLALAGPRDGNPAAHALFVWLWVGLIPISVIFGPVWRAVNPLRTIFTLLGLPPRGLRPLPADRKGSSWPAAAFLLAFVWFELLAPHRGDPVAVGLWILAYGLAQMILALLRGEEWFARGDCFEVYSDLAGRLSPLRHRPPLSGLAVTETPSAPSPVPPPAPSLASPKSKSPATTPKGKSPATTPKSKGPATTSIRPPLPAAGITGFIAVWWGSTVFDSAAASPLWTRTAGGAPVLLGTAALALLCTLIFLAVRRTAGHDDLSLVPIAVGYTLAHYLSLLIIEAPQGFLLLIGAPTTAWTPDLAPTAITTAQIALILIGHALGVIVAHDRSLAATPQRPTLAVLADELPMVLFMIACTWTGLFLLFVR
ncbi:hypothetical protein [Actinoplanes subglobosus]|uniref:Uncharacterized protein n=1 Tax=Actinoplanes subglobosus TaxID=1547892 RepID=A0ABV8J1R0_9ACTN